MTLTFFGMSSHTFQLTTQSPKCCPNPESISTLGLASFAFARHYLRNLGWCLFLALLRCFSSGGSPLHTILFIYRCISFSYADCSIRISAGHSVLATYRSFSQLTTSFIGSWCQGILPTLFVAYSLWIMQYLPLKLYNYTIFQKFFFKKSLSFIFPICITSSYSVFKLLFLVLFNFCFVVTQDSGHKWDRTTDLTLIRRAL